MNASRIANRLSQAKLIHHWKRNQESSPAGEVASGLIVSLTSFPARIKTAWIAVESVIRQRIRPERITLVLDSSEFGINSDLPRELEKQKKHGLEIIWTNKDLRSYGKLIPVKARYPEAPIVTIDDDIIYQEHMLANLLESHQADPYQIAGCRGYEIQKDIDGTPLPYTTWTPASIATASSTCFLTGVGGVLYPPDSLPWDVACNSELFGSLCPTADDIWFWAMSLIHGSQRQCLGEHSVKEIKRFIKTSRLSRNNVSRGGNDRQLQLVINHFSLDSLSRKQSQT
ncbi:hypothetical protein KBY70_12245 [Cyanobium sp. ATX 6E8]|nr:hypothetical protein [Cyanobium sp. ATX 6E8]